MGWGEGRCRESSALTLCWQVLHNLSLWTASRTPLTDQVAKTDATRAKREVKLVSTTREGRQ